MFGKLFIKSKRNIWEEIMYQPWWRSQNHYILKDYSNSEFTVLKCDKTLQKADNIPYFRRIAPRYRNEAGLE